MSLLTQRRSRAQSGVELARQTVGNALVVHATGITAEARLLAMSLAVDPEYDLVVADLPTDSPAGVWESLASAFPRGRRGVRLVLARQSSELGPLAGNWLSERLGRTVVAPVGVVSQAEDGSLFVHSGPGSGWVRFRRGRKPEWESKRFPRPSWDSRAVAELRQTGSGSVAEPLPAGMWVRPHGEDAWLNPSRARLSRALPCRSETLAVVLGGRGIPELALEDVGRFWATLPEDDRSRVRFVQYGPVSLPHGGTLGQALADLLDTEVVCYSGIPVGPAKASEVFTLRSDGSHGWNTYAQQFIYQPQDAAPPRLCGYRRPVAGLPEVAPGVYRCAPDAVLEVVQAGLWLRPPDEPAHAAAIRSAPADPAIHVLRYEATGQEQAERMRTLAEEALAHLDYSTRLTSRLIPVIVSDGELLAAPAEFAKESKGPVAVAAPVEPHVSEVSAQEPAEVSLTWLATLLDTNTATEHLPGIKEDTRPPADENARAVPVKAELEAPIAVAQPVPAPSVSSRLPEQGIDSERKLLRETWQRDFDQQADAVNAVLAGNPKLLGGSSHPVEDVLTDTIAVRLYLAGQGPDVDRGLRTAEPGPHVAFGRCVTAGLTLLPSHRGPVVSTVTPTPPQWEFYGQHPVLTEWGFLNLLTKPSGSEHGDVDLLVWSMTGRKTALLEPVEGLVDGRVVFLPGTSFKVLELIEPKLGTRGRILLRELSPTEVDADGNAASNRASLDKLAKTSLERSAASWARAEPRERIPAVSAGRFRSLPGVV